MPNDTEKCESDIAHIRRRPGMYIGGFNERGLAHLIDVLIDELLEESGERLSRVGVSLLKDDFVEIRCMGAINEIRPEDFLRFPQIGPGENWKLGTLILAAMSDRLDAEIIRDGERWEQSFAAGVPVAPAKRDRIDAPSSLRLRYRADPSLFKDLKLPHLCLCGRIQEFAIFYPQTVFEIDDQRGLGVSRQYHYRRGLLDYAEELEYDSLFAGPGHLPNCFELSSGPNRVQAVLIHTHFGLYTARSYVNRQRTAEGGSHVEAFEKVFKKAVTPYLKRGVYPYGKEDDPFHGLTLLLAVELSHPNYGGSTKAELRDEIAATLVAQMFNEQLPPLLARLCAT